jgi:ubiquinone/menaquinone biosynthesis C-methylase UbiE
MFIKTRNLLGGGITKKMDYTDSRVAEIYDAANPLAEDGLFYLALAGSRPRTVLDLGCGTGALCCALAERGHEITGVDPAAAMLDVARRKPHPNQVEWVEATAQSYQSQKRFDLILMTGHAFQTLLIDADILATFETMRVHLNDGGRIAFETRNPRVDWASEWAGRQRLIRMPSGEKVLETLEIRGAGAEFISFQTTYRFPHTTLTTSSTLRFPAREHVERLLGRAGLGVRVVFGDWELGRFDQPSSREMIFVAERAG